MHDLLIRNARIVDGSGGPSRHGAVAVSDGRVTETGDVNGLARRIVDAEGLVVAPGFVDIHTHYDAQLAWDPLCTPSCYHGTTSIVMSNCGYGMAPVRAEDRDYTMGTFSCVEGVSKETLINGLPWEWETLPEYLSWLERRGLGINVAAQVGHSAVRRWVLGPEAHEREATPDEIATMRAMVREGMDAGGIGFTTSRVAHQKGEFGEPIPSFVAHEDEIFELAGVLRDLGRGIIGINPRTKSLEFVQEDKDQLYALAARTGRPVNWNEFNQRDIYPGQWRVLLDYMEHAQELGAMVYAVMRCQRMDMHFNLRETHAFNRSQLWRDFMGRPTEAKLRELDDADLRRRLLEEMRPRFSQGGAGSERLAVAIAATDRHRGLDGRLVNDAAAETGEEPGELFFRIAREEQLETEFAYHGVTNGDDEAVAAMIASPGTIVGISDAGAHLHTMSGVDYPTYFLGRWVRDKQLMSLEAGVAALTSTPARLAGLEGRGVIAPGSCADLCIFDPDTVGPRPMEIWTDLPGGESRHVKRAAGVREVIVNGEALVRDGEPTEALPGRVLRHGR